MSETVEYITTESAGGILAACRNDALERERAAK